MPGNAQDPKTCPYCMKQEISPRATACPNCGEPLQEKSMIQGAATVDVRWTIRRTLGSVFGAVSRAYTWLVQQRLSTRTWCVLLITGACLGVLSYFIALFLPLPITLVVYSIVPSIIITVPFGIFMMKAGAATDKSQNKQE